MSLPVLYPYAAYVDPCFDPPFPAAVAVYGLYDPRDGALRYIGKSTHIRGRIAKHRRAEDDNPRPSHRGRWLREMREAGYVVRVAILTWSTAGTWEASERAYIAEARALGCRLTNKHPGGQRGSGGRPTGFNHSPQARAAMSRSATGRVMSPESIAKSVAGRAATIAARGFMHTPEGRSALLARVRIDPTSPQAEQVRAIRRRWTAGESYGALAEAFGCSKGRIGAIVAGHLYAYILPATVRRPPLLPPPGRSGVRGVEYVSDPRVKNKWRAVVRDTGRDVILGHFATIADAAAAISLHSRSGPDGRARD